MTKIKKLITAVFTAIVLALLCLLPVFGGGTSVTKAFADVDDDNTIYEKLMYFSDDFNSVSRYNNYISGYITQYNQTYKANMSGELICCANDNADASKNLVLRYFNQYPETFDLKNSLVIFEINNENTLKALLNYPANVSSYNTTLCNIFMSLHNKNCKIMFITDFEEVWFKTRKAFLGLVDIHINTCLFTNFLANMLFRANYTTKEEFLENGCSDLDNCTFIFDQSLSYGADQPGDDMSAIWIMKTYIISYIKHIYESEIIGVENGLKTVLENKGVEFLFYAENGMFYDIVRNVGVNANDEETLRNYFDGQKVFAFGTSWYGEVALNGFISVIQNFAISNEYSPQFFIYNEDGYDLNIDPQFILRDGGGNLCDLENLLQPIVYDFIMGNDLTVYHNWSGLCKITYKPVTFSEDGWLLNFGLEGEGSGDGLGWSWEED